MRIEVSGHGFKRAKERLDWSPDTTVLRAEEAIRAPRGVVRVRKHGIYLSAALTGNLIKVVNGIVFVFGKNTDGWNLVTLFRDEHDGEA